MPYNQVDLSHHIDSYYEFNPGLKGYLPTQRLEWPPNDPIKLGTFLHNLTTGRGAGANSNEAEALNRAGLGDYVKWNTRKEVFELDPETPRQGEHGGDSVAAFPFRSTRPRTVQEAVRRARMPEFVRIADTLIKNEARGIAGESDEARAARLTRATKYREAARSEPTLKNLGMTGDSFKQLLTEIKTAGPNADIQSLPTYRNLSDRTRMSVNSLINNPVALQQPSNPTPGTQSGGAAQGQGQGGYANPYQPAYRQGQKRGGPSR